MKISQYFLAFFLLPPLCAVWFINRGQENLKALSHAIDEEGLYSKKLSDKKKQSDKISQSILKGNPHYLAAELVPFKPLKNEIKRLETLLSHQHATVGLLERLDFLRTKNRIDFVEEKRVFSDKYQEVSLSLKTPIDVDDDDLKFLLVHLEGISIGTITPPSERPDLSITDFELKKQTTSSQEESYRIHFKLLKRESA